MKLPQMLALALLTLVGAKASTCTYGTPASTPSVAPAPTLTTPAPSSAAPTPAPTFHITLQTTAGETHELDFQRSTCVSMASCYSSAIAIAELGSYGDRVDFFLDSDCRSTIVGWDSSEGPLEFGKSDDLPPPVAFGIDAKRSPTVDQRCPVPDLIEDPLE